MSRPASAALISYLYSRQPFYMPDLFTFTLRGGAVYRWTDFDQPVTYSDNTWLAQGPLIKRTRLSVKNTVEVPEMDIRLYALDNDFDDGLNVKTQLHNGAFDGATVTLERIGLKVSDPSYTGLGTVLLFGGRMSSAKIDAVGAALTIKGANVLMNQYVPRNQYQTSDNHTFCDAGCTLSAADFTLTDQDAASGSTNRVIQWSTPPSNQALYKFGKLTMTSGVAIGQVRTVAEVTAGQITLAYPLYDTPAPGDTFSIEQGCDLTFNSGSGQDCTARSNTGHYRGFPFIPVAETAA